MLERDLASAFGLPADRVSFCIHLLRKAGIRLHASELTLEAEGVLVDLARRLDETTPTEFLKPERPSASARAIADECSRDSVLPLDLRSARRALLGIKPHYKNDPKKFRELRDAPRARLRRVLRYVAMAVLDEWDRSGRFRDVDTRIDGDDRRVPNGRPPWST